MLAPTSQDSQLTPTRFKDCGQPVQRRLGNTNATDASRRRSLSLLTGKALTAALSGGAKEVENWDEDFEDKPDPSVRRHIHPHASLASAAATYDDFEHAFLTGKQELSFAARAQRVASWTSTDDENDAEFGFMDESLTLCSHHDTIGASPGPAVVKLDCSTTRHDRASPSSSSSGFITRITSVKWGVRTKRASTGPSLRMSAIETTKSATTQGQSVSRQPLMPANSHYHAVSTASAGTQPELKGAKSQDRLKNLAGWLTDKTSVTPSLADSSPRRNESNDPNATRRHSFMQASTRRLSFLRSTQVSTTTNTDCRKRLFQPGLQATPTHDANAINPESVLQARLARRGANARSSNALLQRHRRSKSGGDISEILQEWSTDVPCSVSQTKPPVLVMPHHSPVDLSSPHPPSLHTTTHDTPAVLDTSHRAPAPPSRPFSQLPTPKSPSASIAPRRNSSLGDLKIPVQISQAQDRLRRDLVYVREFAAQIEHMKVLQASHKSLIARLQAIINAMPPPTSPPAANRSFRSERGNLKNIANAFRSINVQYDPAWECAMLLIELASGPSETSRPSSPDPPSNSSTDSQRLPKDATDRAGRERAITLVGANRTTHVCEKTRTTGSSRRPMTASGASPPPGMGHRQLSLLREMMDDSALSASAVQMRMLADSDGVGGRDSSMESAAGEPCGLSAKERHRWSKLGVSGFRDVLKSLMRGASRSPPRKRQVVDALNDISPGRGTSEQREDWLCTTPQRRTQTGAFGPRQVDLLACDGDPPTSAQKSPPRRPSLASLFQMSPRSRLQMHNAPSPRPGSMVGQFGGVMNAKSKIGNNSRPADTVPDQRSPSSPFTEAKAHLRKYPTPTQDDILLQWSLPKQIPIPPYPASTQCAAAALGDSVRNVHVSAGDAQDINSHKLTGIQQLLLKSSQQSATVPTSTESAASTNGPTADASLILKASTLNSRRLAFTPENIRSLLENAREVTARLNDCVTQLERLLEEI